MNKQFLEMVAAHKKANLQVVHYDHMNKDEWLAVFSCEDDGTKLEIRAYGQTPEMAVSNLYGKWSDARIGATLPIFQPVIEHHPAPRSKNFNLDDEVPF